MANATTASSIDSAAERKAAEWVQSVRGSMSLVRPDGRPPLEVAGKMPDGPIAIASLTIDRNHAITDDDLVHLSGWRVVSSINLYNTSLTGSGLAHLKSVRSLISLSLPGQLDAANENKQMTDEALVPLGELPRLRNLQLTHNQRLTEASLATVCKLTELEGLELAEIPITDRGLQQLDGLKKLIRIDLYSTRVTDDGLKQFLAQHPNLKSIRLGTGDPQFRRTLISIAGAPVLEHLAVTGDQLTEEGVNVLAQLSALRSLDVSYPMDGSIALLNAPQLKSLTIDFNGTPIAATEAQAILRSTELDSLLISGHAGSPDDATLKILTGLTKLKTLQIQFSSQMEPRPYTAAGIEKFREVRPDVVLTIDDQTYPATKPAN